MPTDLELVERYKKNSDVGVIGLLFERYGHLVFGLCVKMLSDGDLAQEAVSQIFEKLLDSLKTSEIRYFPAWIHQVAKNHCLLLLKKRQKFIEPVENEPISEEDFEPWEKTTHDLQLENLSSSIALLPNNQRICIELFYLNELSYKQIEAQTNMKFSEIKSHIQNGKRNLRLMLTSQKSLKTKKNVP